MNKLLNIAILRSLNKLLGIPLMLWISSIHLTGQQLESIIFKQDYLSIEKFNNKHSQDGEVALFSVNIDGELFFSDQEPSVNGIMEFPKHIHASWDSITWDHQGLRGSLVFKNNGLDTISIANVVPFGEDPERIYITGLGDHRLSRTHLFRPGLSPVNVIVPDNAWELGYSAIPLEAGKSVCALTRRVFYEKAQRRRFETLLFPGGSVTYKLYADIYEGTWQEGLRKIFQDRYLYDVEMFDNELFERDDLKWIRNKYIIHLIMAWDKKFYNEELGGYQIENFLDKGKEWYGGDDVIGIWPTWPSLGIDQRNQFDLFRDLPGGLQKINDLVQEFRPDGTYFFLCYNPWDESTREENHLDGLKDLIRLSDVDGMVLDTRGASSKELQEAADAVKKGVVMYSEGMAVPKDMQGIVSGRVHNALYFPPLLNLNKFIKPEFAIFRVAELYKEPIQREFATSFFNGYGTELNIFAPGQPSWATEQYRYLGKTSRILRENTINFTEGELTPLVPTLRDSIYVNKWVTNDKTIYSILSLIPEGYKAPLFEIDIKEDHHFIDLWHHKELTPILIDGKYYIEVEANAFNKSDLGTNNEGEVDCIAELPKLLEASLNGDVLKLKSKQGSEIKIWAGMPSYENSPVVMEVGTHEIHLMEVFGRYEGKFVLQLFEKDILLDERVFEIKPGTPRLVSQTENVYCPTQNEMIEIPAGTFVFNATHGDEFIRYPDFQQDRSFEMKPFFMDKYPVTNAEYYEFIKATGYHPEDDINFLKHWIDGKFPEGKGSLPVVYISYEDAKAYANWAQKRLPTEIEWQYAAQTEALYAWPWGNGEGIYREEQKITETLTTLSIKGIDGKFCNLGNGNLDPVGSYPEGKNPFGLEDLVGSVWQLTNDVYKSGSYDYIMMKGGSFYNPSSSWWYVQGGPRELHYRQYLLRVSQGFERNTTVGFRCVADKK